MKLLPLILFVIGCNACGSDGVDIDAELKPWVDLYFSYAPDRGRYDEITSIKFGDPGDGSDGSHDWSTRHVGGYELWTDRTITIRKDVPFNCYMQAVLMHELAHAVHDIDHSGDKRSLMHSRFVEDDAYWCAALVPELQKLWRHPDAINP